jgi:hypothetical protein
VNEGQPEAVDGVGGSSVPRDDGSAMCDAAEGDPAAANEDPAAADENRN